MFQSFFRLTKAGIVVFVLFTGTCGYLLGLPLHIPFDPVHLGMFLIGLFWLSSGSFALNQVQEKFLDCKMKRTQKRPLVREEMTRLQGFILSCLLMLGGLFFLYTINSRSFFLGVLTVVLYNGFYTLIWKKKWAFGAVPGALPGALPIVIGYSASYPFSILNLECVYLFSLMFFWQMPHFWAIALRYKEDYKRANIPVLPVKVGTEKTLMHMTSYLVFYLWLVLVSPLFVRAYWLYYLLVIPMVIKTAYEFYKYYQNETSQKKEFIKKPSYLAWRSFFIWINLSLLVFVLVPVLDTWIFF